MDVDDAARERIKQWGLDHAHVTREHDEVGDVGGEFGGEGGFGLGSQLGTEWAWRDFDDGDVVLCCDPEDACAGLIACDDGDLGLEFAGGDGVKDRLEVGSAT